MIVNENLFFLNYASTDGTISVTTTASQAVVGSEAVLSRKLVILEPLDGNIKWGFSGAAQNFNLNQNQTLTLSVGANISLWVKTASGTVNVAIAEIS